MSRKKVLVVDDESNVRESLKLILSRHYEVSAVENGEEALSTLDQQKGDLPDIALLDLVMPGYDGLGLLKKIKDDYPSLPVIMLTATKTVRTAVEAMKLGAIDYLNKPFDVDELLNLIDTSLGEEKTFIHHVERSGLRQLEGDFGGLVGTHTLMQELYLKVDQLAKRDTTILITGESGTGKEVIAREIHKRSSRSQGPFIALNCAAIPETLIESELFGHERGAFTHAVEKRLGQFELADGGTLFLDEIGELSLPVQVKMLRFLQEKEFYRVGRSKPIHVNVRVLAATNKSLETAIKEGSFRQDLFYRINVVALEMPPLRERKEDIPGLVHFFVERLSPLYGGRKPLFTSEALEALADYSWPGNVRELENVTESILALTTVEEITPNELPSRIRSTEQSDDLKQDVLDGKIPFEEAERAFETDLIKEALRQTNFVQTKAAKMLGISRRILKYKMDKLGITENADK